MPPAHKLASYVISFLILASPASVFAAGLLVTIVPQECNQTGGCPSICNVAELFQHVLNDAIYFAVVISAFLFAYAGWQYLTAGGEPYKAKQAKKVFRDVVVGLCIIVAAWLAVDTLLNILTGATGLEWNRIC